MRDIDHEGREDDGYADDALLRALEEEYGIEGDFTVSIVALEGSPNLTCDPTVTSCRMWLAGWGAVSMTILHYSLLILTSNIG